MRHRGTASSHYAEDEGPGLPRGQGLVSALEAGKCLPAFMGQMTQDSALDQRPRVPSPWLTYAASTSHVNPRWRCLGRQRESCSARCALLDACSCPGLGPLPFLLLPGAENMTEVSGASHAVSSGAAVNSLKSDLAIFKFKRREENHSGPSPGFLLTSP